MRKDFEGWVESRSFGLFAFNLVIMLLVLLRSAGYFQPIFLLSINVVVLTGVILSVILLGFRSQELFLIAVAFWFLTGIFKVMRIDYWAERTSIYVFESVAIGVLILVFECVNIRRK